MSAHFIDRCKERLPDVEPCKLLDDLRLAFMRVNDGTDQDGDYIEKAYAMPGEPSRDLYRFRVASGLCFTLFSVDGYPLTIIDRSMIANYRRKRRAVKVRARRAVTL